MKKLFGFVLLLIVTASVSFGQAISVNGGSIQGSITDNTGALVPGATVVITGTDTGFTKTATADSSGFYTVGPLNPGNYTINVSATGFQKLSVKTVVRTGTVTSGNFKLPVGNSSETVEVNAGEVQVNTEQAGVSDVITREQIASLPINGRNFLDVAQIEPGVILQSGETFDPTKAGYSAISVSGVSGRTTRILLDGQDITDETVGTTIFNVSQGAINEFQLNRSTQDVSGEVTSNGQVLVSTNSGTNAIHGQLFYNFQDYRALFASGGATNPPFQRNQFGGAVGGPIIKDKLFFFANSERIKQDSSTQVVLGPLFQNVANQYPSLGTPYRETYSTGRLDYNGPFGGHYFVRVNYNVNAVVSSFNNGYSLYANRDNTPGIAGGADFATGHFTHSFRGSYEKFHNFIADATTGNMSIYNPIPGATLQFLTQQLYSGPNVNAPQGTFQSDKQFRYDGTWTKGPHNVRYGYSMNRILGGGFAAFYGLAPRIRTTSGFLLPGHSGTDILNDYTPSSILLGNGQGFFTEKPSFGLNGGGTSDWRQAAYLSDSWKITPNFTLTAGVRWSIDTQRANQDLQTPLCSDIVTSNFKLTAAPCTGSTPLFSVFDPSFTDVKIKQPYANFSPQLGFAYGLPDHKTVLRGAAGIFYDSNVFNNTTNARNSMLKSGPFFNSASICGSGTLVLPNGQAVTSATVNGVQRSINAVCNSSIAQAAPYAIALQQQYQQSTAQNQVATNGGFIGANLTSAGIYGPKYKTPFAEQFNFGIQREIFRGAVITADYVHNATLKIGQYVDVNRVGAARYFNAAAARNAITTANATVGCAPTDVTCGISRGLTIADYGAAGLDSGVSALSGNPAGFNGRTPNTGAAFPGANNLLGQGRFILPNGKAGYDALQVVYRQVVTRPMPGLESSNLQVSYSLSKAVATGDAVGSSSASGTSDSFFAGNIWDNDNPGTIIGRSTLDHKHQVNFGGSVTLKYGPKIGLIGHFYSAQPNSLTLDSGVLLNGNIFQSDLNGDGTTGDLLPGTNPGDYMHEVKANTLQGRINAFNATYLGRLTPAGQALVNSGLVTQQQMVAMKATIRPIANLANSTALNNPAFRSMDVNFSYPIRFYRLREGLSLEPAIAFYNVGNFSNYNTLPLGNTLTNIDDGTVTNGANQNPTTRTGPNTFGVLNGLRNTRGSGTFNQGSPRTTEFQVKLNF